VERANAPSDSGVATLLASPDQAASSTAEQAGLPPTPRLAELLRRRPLRFVHAHPPVRNVNALLDIHRTWGQHVADWVAATMGSWRFIILQSLLLAVWIALNTTAALLVARTRG
jgi:hypothetical protein